MGNGGLGAEALGVGDEDLQLQLYLTSQPHTSPVFLSLGDILVTG